MQEKKQKKREKIAVREARQRNRQVLQKQKVADHKKTVEQIQDEVSKKQLKWF